MHPRYNLTNGASPRSARSAAQRRVCTLVIVRLTSRTMRVGGTDTPARTRVTISRSYSAAYSSDCHCFTGTADCTAFTQYWRAPLLQRLPRPTRAPPPSPRATPPPASLINFHFANRILRNLFVSYTKYKNNITQCVSDTFYSI